MRVGALEGGGTKMVMAVCGENGEVLERASIPTEDPSITIPAMVEWFKGKDIEALGIGFFGPVQLNQSADNYGSVTKTPKLAWTDTQIVKPFAEGLNIPVAFDTDVNAAIGEATWGSAKGTKNSIYITIGTGVGIGVISNGQVLHGLMHPEGGHVLLQKHPKDNYKGHCPFHPNCLEGLAAGPAIEDRWGKKAVELADQSEVWEIEAFYIAQGIVDIILLLSPEIITIGGGVMHQTQVLPMIHSEVKRLLNGYLKIDEMDHLEKYIVLPALNDNQGIMGCAKLAMDLLKA